MVVKLKTPKTNSKGELCRWAVKSHRDNRILACFPTEAEAIKHLKRIQFFKHIKEDVLIKLKDEILNEVFSKEEQIDITTNIQVLWNKVQKYVLVKYCKERGIQTNDVQEIMKLGKRFAETFPTKGHKNVKKVDEEITKLGFDIRNASQENIDKIGEYIYTEFFKGE
jgi:hypothetical protein